MLEVFSVESRKGGVGKTTIALNLAKALVRKNYDVLLLDCDITGTPITTAAANSLFWKDDVIVSKKDNKPYNLIEFFDTVFLKGFDRNIELIKGLEYNPKKIHLIGSEIYDTKGNLIIDPRILMDDLHSYWFLDFIKSIANLFCDKTKQEKKALVLDNSPGYVGIGRSVREWLTKLGPETATFVLVTSLDEQDIESTISSASEIERMMDSGAGVNSYVKVVINKVPDFLLSESGGYNFKVKDEDTRKDLVDVLFPLGNDRYPINIIKYDRAISGQFVEASLLPRKSSQLDGTELNSVIRSFDKKVYTHQEKKDQYADIASLDYYYTKLLKALADYGYRRLSQSLGGVFMPSHITKDLKSIVGDMDKITYNAESFIMIPKEALKDEVMRQLRGFVERKGLEQYFFVFKSLIDGIYKVAGYERKESDYNHLFNLTIMLMAFFDMQDQYYAPHGDYSGFLIKEKEDLTPWRIGFYPRKTAFLRILSHLPQEMESYLDGLFLAFSKPFYQAMCYTLLRMMDCREDYFMILDTCRTTIDRGAKIISEDLTEYLKRVVVDKIMGRDLKLYFDLVNKPYEMKAIMKMMTNFVLDK